MSGHVRWLTFLAAIMMEFGGFLIFLQFCMLFAKYNKSILWLVAGIIFLVLFVGAGVYMGTRYL